jgi:hypothetical protein
VTMRAAAGRAPRTMRAPNATAKYTASQLATCTKAAHSCRRTGRRGSVRIHI